MLHSPRLSLPKLILLCLACALFAPLNASAQNLPKHNANWLPYTPQQVKLDKCGLSVPVDPRWIYETKTKQKNGLTTYSYHFSINPTFWKKYPQPFSKFALEPQFYFSVYCDARGDDVAGFAKRFQKISAKSKTERDSYSPLAKKNTPAGKLYYFTKVDHTINAKPLLHRRSDQLHGVLKTPNGKATLYFNASRDLDHTLHVDVFGYKKRKNGFILEKQLDDGGVLRAELTSKAYVKPNGNLHYFRTRKQNLDFIWKIIKGLRVTS
ncbi:hypothetical protein [Shimia sp.]|uniref:hypothetical protein n=1 Tax=Shimia sp. TaxID=1954381 RepID=UPI003296E5FB